jgi:hypothetical protein
MMAISCITNNVFHFSQDTTQRLLSSSSSLRTAIWNTTFQQTGDQPVWRHFSSEQSKDREKALRFDLS